MRENPTRRWRACATGSATLAMVLMVTACGTTPPVLGRRPARYGL